MNQTQTVQKRRRRFAANYKPVEWGPDLGFMSWHQAQDRLNELNKNLPPDKRWRLPSPGRLKTVFAQKEEEFSSFEKKPYWSSRVDKELIIAVDFGHHHGDRVWMEKIYPSARVRFIR